MGSRCMELYRLLVNGRGQMNLGHGRQADPYEEIFAYAEGGWT